MQSLAELHAEEKLLSNGVGTGGQTCTAYRAKQATATNASTADSSLAAGRAVMCPATGLDLLGCSSAAPPVSFGHPSHYPRCPCWLLQDKAAQKADKDAMEAKYKFAMVDGRKEQVCGGGVFSPGSAGKSLGTGSRLGSTVVGQAQDGSRFRPCDGNCTVD